jgi:O-antigen ligase
VATLVRWSFLLFVFSMPFETLETGFTSSSLSLARAAGLLLFAACLIYPKQCFQRPPGAMWWFIGYIAIYSLHGLYLPDEYWADFVVGLFTRVQLFIFFWIAASLLKDEEFARHALLAFAIATLFLSLGMAFKLPGFHSHVREGRTTVIGANANGLAFVMACAVLILLGLWPDKGVRRRWQSTALILSLFPLLAGLIMTGSRGGMTVLVIGASLYLAMRQNFKRKKALIFWGLMTLGAMVYMAMHDPTASSRWEETYSTGSTSGRDTIYDAAIAMVYERPILGWQPVRSFFELGWRVKKATGRDTHSLFLALLTEVGLLGTLPFLIGLWLCIQAAWKARGGNLGAMPLSLMAALLAFSTVNTTLTGKTMWFILGVGIASGSMWHADPRRRVRVLVNDRFSRSGRGRYGLRYPAIPGQVTGS